MGTLDPQKLIELKINHMNIFYMRISQITVHVIDNYCMGTSIYSA